MARQRMMRDELTAFKQLSPLGSLAANIAVSLGLARDMIRQASDLMQGERAAQITPTTIVYGMRFRLQSQERTLRTGRGRRHEQPDPVGHPIQRHGLQEEYSAGATGSAESSTAMAGRARTAPPGMALPVVEDL